MHTFCDFIIGIDVGQLHDFSAVTVLEREEMPGKGNLYQVRHIDRFRSIPYPTAVERIRTLYESTELYARSTLVLDATGVGRGVLDIMDAAGIKAHIVPVTITAGEEVGRQGREVRVPKSHLVFEVQNALSMRRLRLAEHLPETPLLVQELGGFRVRFGPSGREVYGNDVRETPFDDLVLSLALALWYGEKGENGGSGGWLQLMRHRAQAGALGIHPGSRRVLPVAEKDPNLRATQEIIDRNRAILDR